MDSGVTVAVWPWQHRGFLAIFSCWTMSLSEFMMIFCTNLTCSTQRTRVNIFVIRLMGRRLFISALFFFWGGGVYGNERRRMRYGDGERFGT